MYKKSVFIFRRSFRIPDNTGLIEALKNSEKVIPIFILTPEQLTKNSFKSNNAVKFMFESINELDSELKKNGSKVFFFFGKQEKIIEKLIKEYDIDAVFINRDYTPYAMNRDKKIKNVCEKNKVGFHSFEDFLIQPINSVKTASKEPYLKFTPYFLKARKAPVLKPMKTMRKNFCSKSTKLKNQFKGAFEKFYKKNDEIKLKGGRENGLKILKNIKKFKDYDKKRNNLSFQTTLLAAHIKFGTVSIREVFYAIKKIESKELLRQLYWRDFYYNIAYNFSDVFKGPMKEKFKRVSWSRKRSLFDKWKKGETGFPIVDACMRELNRTGFMHNRGRLIVSSFLTKILFIDWKKGEKYFAQKLVDYDPCVNNGNWQWSASTGVDSQPYFRIFNPFTQSKKYDLNAKYIKKWVPELKDVPEKDIFRWDKKYFEYKTNYVNPVVSYEKERGKTLARFKKYFG